MKSKVNAKICTFHERVLVALRVTARPLGLRDLLQSPTLKTDRIVLQIYNHGQASGEQYSEETAEYRWFLPKTAAPEYRCLQQCRIQPSTCKCPERQHGQGEWYANMSGPLRIHWSNSLIESPGALFSSPSRKAKKPLSYAESDAEEDDDDEDAFKPRSGGRAAKRRRISVKDDSDDEFDYDASTQAALEHETEEGQSTRTLSLPHWCPHYDPCTSLRMKGTRSFRER